MENGSSLPEGKRSHLWNWLDPTRIYNPTVPAGRSSFLWGLVIYPVAVIFVMLTVIIIVMEATIASANIADAIGIVTWVFMLAWVVATICICRRRLLDLGKSQAWVWLAILPVINLVLFAYLLFKPGPLAHRHAA